MLSKFENCKREIFTIGNNFKLYNVVSYNYKNKDDNKLDPIYENNYSSSKYSNINELTNLFIRSSNYLVFNYRDNVDGQFVTEDVYVSYPNIEILRDFLTNALEDILKNVKNYYSKTNITEQAEEVIFESEPFAQGKKLAIVPYKIERTSQNSELSSYVNGVVLFVNEESNFVEMDINTFTTLVEIINNDFSLLHDSAMTFIMNQLYELSKMVQNMNNSGNHYSGGSSNRFSRPSSRNTPRANIFKNNSSSSPRGNKNQSTSKIERINEDEIDNLIDNSEDETPTKKNSFSRKTTVKKPKKSVENEDVNLKDLDNMMNDEEESDPVISLDDAIKMASEDVDLAELGLDDV